MKTRLRGFVYRIFLSKFDSFWFCIAWHSRVTAKPHRVVVGWKSVEDITTSKFIYIDTVSIDQPAKLFRIFIHFFYLSLFSCLSNTSSLYLSSWANLETFSPSTILSALKIEIRGLPILDGNQTLKSCHIQREVTDKEVNGLLNQ